MVTPAKYQGLQARQIVISNAITRAAQGITLVEKRILFSAWGRFRIRKLKHVKRSDTQQLRGFAQAANP